MNQQLKKPSKRSIKSHPKKSKKPKPSYQIKTLNDQELGQIDRVANALKLKYGFKSDYNLFQKIKSLPTEIHLGQNATLNHPRDSVKKITITNLISTAETLIELMQHGAAQVLIDIQQSKHKLSENGYNNLTIQNGEWTSHKFLEDLITFYLNCITAKQFIPPDPGGNVPFSIPKLVIFYLAAYYAEGTGKDPTCGWLDEKDNCVGEFYYFISDIQPALHILNIKLGTQTTVCTYATEALAKYRSIIKSKQA